MAYKIPLKKPEIPPMWVHDRNEELSEWLKENKDSQDSAQFMTYYDLMEKAGVVGSHDRVLLELWSDEDDDPDDQ